jgi:hypothetical protein
MLIEILFPMGKGKVRRGKPRRINLFDWLTACGTGSFIAALAFLILGVQRH